MYNNKYHKKEKKEFKTSDLQKKTIKDGLIPSSPYINFTEFENIYIDLDSILSIFIAYEIPTDKEERMDLLISILSYFKDFFHMYGESYTIYILYGFKKEVFNEIYEDWQSDRIKRLFNKTVLDFILKDLVKRLSKIADKSRNIFVKEWKEAFVIDVLRDLEKYEDPSECILITRNIQSLCLLPYYNISIYNGSKIIDKYNYKNNKNYPHVDKSFIPAWFLIRGDLRNNYHGKPLYGVIKTDKYIRDNKIDCIDMESDFFKDIIQYKKLYFLKEWI